MKKVIIITLLTAVSLCASYSASCDNEDRPIIARVYFEPQTYEAYQQWMNETLDEIKGTPSHETPRVWIGEDAYILLRSNRDHLRNWLLTVLSIQPEEITGESRYILDVPLGNLEVLEAKRWFQRIFDGFVERTPGNAAAYEAKLVELKAERKKLNARIVAVEADLERRKANMIRQLGGLKMEDIQRRMMTAEDAMLKVKMDVAEKQARLRSIMDQLRKEQAEAANRSEEPPNIHRVMLKVEVENVQKRVLELKAQHDQLVGRFAEGHPQLKTVDGELKKAEKSLEALSKRALFRVPSPLEERLKQLMAETEIDLAGLEARKTELNIHRSDIDPMLDRAMSLEDGLSNLRVYVKDLQNEILELDASAPTGPEDFPIPKPVIRWVEEPEAAEAESDAGEN